MTLNTKFYVTTPGINPMELWNILMPMVETEDTVPGSISVGPTKYGPEGAHVFATRPGSGRKAWCDLYYMPDDTELTRHESETDSPDLEDWDKDIFYVPRSYLRMSFDTVYGYRGPEGSASGLHQDILRTLAAFVTEQGGEFIWHDEFAGEWHTDTDSISTLGVF